MTTGRPTSLPALAGIVLAWLVVGVVATLVGTIALGQSGDGLDDLTAVLADLIVPTVPMLVVALLAARWTGREAWHEPDRAQPWVWIAPVSLGAAALFATDWARLAAAGPLMALMLVVGVLLVAGSEELVFRGVVLVGLRTHWREGASALVTTVLFALVHSLNQLALVPLQLAATLFGGYVFYLARRVSGGLAVPILVHALVDLGLFSIDLGPGHTEDNNAPAILLVEAVVCVVFLALFWKIRRPARPGEAVDPTAEQR